MLDPMPRIEAYSFGNMTVDGQRHGNDVKIVDGGVKGDWWRSRGHLLQAEDIRDILEASPAVLVVGTGNSGNMRVDPGVEERLRDAGIRLEAAPTGQAWQTYNRLEEQGEDVAGAFHLTC
jgi:hypothetical protein